MAIQKKEQPLDYVIRWHYDLIMIGSREAGSSDDDSFDLDDIRVVDNSHIDIDRRL